jgi:hypothetical protein
MPYILKIKIKIKIKMENTNELKKKKKKKKKNLRKVKRGIRVLRGKREGRRRGEGLFGLFVFAEIDCYAEEETD